MNNKTMKIIICIAVISILLLSTVFAAGVKKNIEVLFGAVNLTVNGNKVSAETIVYNGTTYVPLRAAAEMLGKDVGWDQKTSTASINDKVAPAITSRLEGLRQSFKAAGFAVSENEAVAYQMINARYGMKFKVDNEYIEIYEYDMNNLPALAKGLIEQAKAGYIEFSGIKISVKLNNGLIMLGHDVHSKGTKIVEIFNSYK